MENLNLAELTNDELIDVNGGFWPYIIGGLIGGLMSQDWDSIGSAYDDGYNANIQ